MMNRNAKRHFKNILTCVLTREFFLIKYKYVAHLARKQKEKEEDKEDESDEEEEGEEKKDKKHRDKKKVFLYIYINLISHLF